MWRQTSKNGNDNDKHVTDIEKKQQQQQDSGIVDSGFLSEIILESSEISGDIDYSVTEKSQEDLDHKNEKEEKNISIEEMRVDSGFDITLSESLSQLSLKHNTLNPLDRRGSRLSREKVQSEPILEPIVAKAEDQRLPEEEVEPWHLYYIQDDDGDTQLHLAIIHGSLEAAAFSLIQTAPHPCLLDIQNDEGHTPLHLAIISRQPRIARRLVLGGANLAVRNLRGNTALHLACSIGDLTAARALTDSVTSIERNYLGAHRTIPALPQNLEQQNYQGETCLHIAALSNHVDLVRLLLHLGADLEAREGLSGKTALHLAIESGCRTVVAFLLRECKPCLDAQTYAGITAYQIAIYADSQLAKELVRLGATAEPLPESESDSDSDDSSDEDGAYMSKITRIRQRVGVRA